MTIMTWDEWKTREERRARRRRPSWGRPIAIGVVLVAIVAVLGTDGFLLSQRHVSTRVSLDQAVTRFRAGRGAAFGSVDQPAAAGPRSAVVTAGGGGAPAAASSAATLGTGAPSSSSSSQSSPGPMAPAPAVPGPAASGPAAPAAPAPYVVPAGGVYGYRTTGGDSISLGGASHQYPSETFATVQQLGGCRWSARNDVIKEHVDTRRFCSQAGQLLQLSQRRDVSFYGQRDGMELACDPPQVLHATSEQPGAVVSSTCSDGQGETAHVDRTFLGMVTMVVGGVSVQVVHLKMHSSFSGRATGTAEDELWLHSINGLTVRWVRSVDTMADSSFGAKVRYQEQASFDLESLTPRT